MLAFIRNNGDRFLLLAIRAIFAACILCGGCAYKGGKIVDGTNIAIGMTIPGTEWQINALDYVAGVRVAGNDQTAIKVTNKVKESNSYFGVVSTSRDTEMTATIEPTEPTENDLSGEVERGDP